MSSWSRRKASVSSQKSRTECAWFADFFHLAVVECQAPTIVVYKMLKNTSAVALLLLLVAVSEAFPVVHVHRAQDERAPMRTQVFAVGGGSLDAAIIESIQSHLIAVVAPVNAPIVLTSETACGKQIPAEHSEAGISGADFVVYVSSTDGPSVFEYCALDQNAHQLVGSLELNAADLPDFDLVQFMQVFPHDHRRLMRARSNDI